MERGLRMNRIEQAVANCDLQPLTVEDAAPPVTAAVAAFFAAAAIGWIVGYNLGHHVEEQYISEILDMDSTLLSAPSSSELLRARQP